MGRAMRNATGLAAVLVMVLGPLLAHFGVVRPLAGFAMFAVGGLVAIVTGLLSLVQAARGRGVTIGGALAVVAGLAFFSIAGQGRGYPRINDFTTDPTNPPYFRFADSLPPNAGRDLRYPPEFAAVQRECCADLAPTHLNEGPPQAYERALRVARGMPSWTITKADPEVMVIEAVSTSRLFRFQDDIVIRISPDGAGSRVDMRSKSRDGKGDMGANANRIRTYSHALTSAG